MSVFFQTIKGTVFKNFTKKLCQDSKLSKKGCPKAPPEETKHRNAPPIYQDYLILTTNIDAEMQKNLFSSEYPIAEENPAKKGLKKKFEWHPKNNQKRSGELWGILYLCGRFLY